MIIGFPAKFNQSDKSIKLYAVFHRGEFWCFLKDDDALEEFFGKSESQKDIPFSYKEEDWVFCTATMKFGHIQKWDAEHKTGIPVVEETNEQQKL